MLGKEEGATGVGRKKTELGDGSILGDQLLDTMSFIRYTEGSSYMFRKRRRGGRREGERQHRLSECEKSTSLVPVV